MELASWRQRNPRLTDVSSGLLLADLPVFVRETERKREWEEKHKWGGAERRGDRRPSRFHGLSTEPDAGLELTNCEIMA